MMSLCLKFVVLLLKFFFAETLNFGANYGFVFRHGFFKTFRIMTNYNIPVLY